MGDTLLEKKFKNLCNVVSDLEKTERTLIEQLSKYKDFHLNKYVRDIESKRDTEYKSIKTIINDVIYKLQEKLELFQNNAFPQLEEIPKFKKEMVDIQNSIHELKHNSKENLKFLNNEEVFLSNEIEKIAENIEKPYQVITILKKEKPSEKKCEKKFKKTVVFIEAKEFMEYVRAISDEDCDDVDMTIEDYIEFIKLCRKNEDMDIVSQKFQKIRPEILEELINDLCEWYLQYKNLKDEQKHVYNDWRKMRHVEPTDRAEIMKKIDNELDIISMKENLHQWKLKRDERKKTLNAYNKFYHLEKNNQDTFESKKRKRIKANIQNWKMNCEKVNKEKALQEKKKAPRFRPTGVNSKIRLYQQRDNKYIQRMRKAKENQTPRPKQTPKTKIEGSKDPARIHKMTKQWMNRIKDKEQTKPSTGLKSIQKLCTPDWRK